MLSRQGSRSDSATEPGSLSNRTETFIGVDGVPSYWEARTACWRLDQAACGQWLQWLQSFLREGLQTHQRVAAAEGLGRHGPWLLSPRCQRSQAPVAWATHGELLVLRGAYKRCDSNSMQFELIHGAGRRIWTSRQQPVLSSRGSPWKAASIFAL